MLRRADQFVDADAEGQIRLFREWLASGALDADETLQMIGEFLGPEEWRDPEQGLRLIDVLWQHGRDLYQAMFGHYDLWLIEDAVARRQFDRIPGLLERFIRAPLNFPGEYQKAIDVLLYHDRLDIVLHALRHIRPASPHQPDWLASISRHLYQLPDILNLFAYIDATPNPLPGDTVLLPQRGASSGADRFVYYMRLSWLLGWTQEPLSLDDFAAAVDEQIREVNSARLTFEWLGDIHRRHSISLAKGELARDTLELYLMKRQMDGATGKDLVCPDPASLHWFLDRWSEGLLDRLHRVGCCIEFMPLYVEHVVRRGWIDQTTANATLVALQPTYRKIVDAIRRWFEDDVLADSIESVWARIPAPDVTQRRTR